MPKNHVAMLKNPRLQNCKNTIAVLPTVYAEKEEAAQISYL